MAATAELDLKNQTGHDGDKPSETRCDHDLARQELYTDSSDDEDGKTSKADSSDDEDDKCSTVQSGVNRCSYVYMY
jgi:hypothetical protein